jgi:integrase
LRGFISINNSGRLRIEKLAVECGWKSVADGSPDSFQEWRAKQEIAPKTKNEYLDAISAMLNWMVENGRLTANPLKAVRKVQTLGKAVRVRRSLTYDELARLFNVSGERTVVYEAGYSTGLRRGELKALE